MRRKSVSKARYPGYATTVDGAEPGSSYDLCQELRALDVVEIFVPPLRQRREEIPVFASFFLEQFNRLYRRDVQLCPDVLAALKAHSWPGNIRELEGALRRLVIGGARSHALLN